MKNHQGGLIKKPRIDLAPCSVCGCRAVTPGVLHELVCVACNGSGWVEAHTGYSLALEELVTQLSFKLQDAERLLRELRRAQPIPQLGVFGPENRFGAGGTNYTGD